MAKHKLIKSTKLQKMLFFLIPSRNLHIALIDSTQCSRNIDISK